MEFDSGMLQFAPKGAYYEEKDEQYKAVNKMWGDLFDYDRVMFALLSILPGTGFSKGIMSHMLLSNPQGTTGRELVPEGLSFDFETKVILYNLHKEKTPRALKNLLFLAGSENKTRVNNARTRKIILQYIFDRDDKSLDYLAVNYKGKLKKLIRHAIGKQDIHNILNGDHRTFIKIIGRYNIEALPVLYHIFNKKLPSEIVSKLYPQILMYESMKEAAKKNDVKKFKSYITKMPYRTAMGFRNLYKLDIDKAEILEKSQMSKKEELQTQAAVKRSGGKKREIDYDKQDVYDLLKLLHFKAEKDEADDVEKILDALEAQHKNLAKVDMGKIAIIMDASKSMRGSDERPLHPFLTALSIILCFKEDTIQELCVVGGKPVTGGYFPTQVFLPANDTNLAAAIPKAVKSGAKSIVLISDGYENTVKGLFNHTFQHFKNKDPELELIHLNPVFSADAKHGTSRMVAEGVKPLPVSNYKFLETEIIFKKIIENPAIVKKLLVTKYNKLIKEET
jgi:hypothetical protein